MTTRETIAGEVRAQMARQKMSGRQLAQKTGLKQPTLARKIAGQVDFSVPELMSVADVLGIPLSTFTETH